MEEEASVVIIIIIANSITTAARSTTIYNNIQQQHHYNIINTIHYRHITHKNALTCAKEEEIPHSPSGPQP